MAVEKRETLELYVATNLDWWKPTQQDLLARDVRINGVCLRRLDPEYYAWLRHKMLLAEKAVESGRISLLAFEFLLVRFNEIHIWAEDRFGREKLAGAMKSLDRASYLVPRQEAASSEVTGKEEMNPAVPAQEESEPAPSNNPKGKPKKRFQGVSGNTETMFPYFQS
jgi:hypothetical protein